MTSAAGERRSSRQARLQRGAVVAAYAAIGAALVWSRLTHLGHSFWTDEIIMVEGYVRGGPDVIFTASSLNHQLLAFVAWAMTPVTGESEIAFRLLSAVPFVAGVVITSAWLHRRHGALAGVLFAFLATASPLLLDVTRQARGYGLTFLAMCVVTVAALEAARTGRKSAVVALCIAGVVGAWTVPQFALAFVPIAVVLALDRRLRLPIAVGLPVSVAAVYVWYAWHEEAVESAAQLEDGLQLGFPWVLTAPLDQIVLPALIWIDGTALVPGIVWLPLVVLTAVVIASSPLLRTRLPALVLLVGPVATVAALWVTQAYVIPRYISYLLVPLFVLLATGASSILGRFGERGAPARTTACLAAIVILAAHFAIVAPDVIRHPREAHRDAARVVEQSGEPTAVVLAYMRDPSNLAFYLDRPVVGLEATDVVERVCTGEEPAFYVMQPFELEDVDVPCLEGVGVVHHRFPQYARGGEMNVWYVPARSG